jgi:ankyrin repeat protein
MNVEEIRRVFYQFIEQVQKKYIEQEEVIKKDYPDPPPDEMVMAYTFSIINGEVVRSRRKPEPQKKIKPIVNTNFPFYYERSTLEGKELLAPFINELEQINPNLSKQLFEVMLKISKHDMVILDDTMQKKLDDLFLYCAGNLLPKLMEYFVLCGASIKAQNKFGQTALHLILDEENYYANDHVGRRIMLNRFFEINATCVIRLDIDTPDGNGNTALFSAIAKGSQELIDILLYHGAKTYIKNNQGRTPYQVQIQKSGEGITHIPYYSPEEKDSSGYNLIHIAAKYVAEGTKKLLLSEQTKQFMNIRTADNEIKPLFSAVSQLLLPEQTKQFVNAQTAENGITPLISAIMSGSEISELVALSDVSIKDMQGNSALHWAAIHAWPDAAKMLIGKNSGLKVSINNEGRNALHCAVMRLYATKRDRKGQIEIIGYLIEAGVDPKQKDAAGKTPLDLAIEAAAKDRKRRTDIVEVLLPHSNVHSKDKNKCTALHRAAEAGYTRLIIMLVASGVKVDTCDAKGRTPLHHAVANQATFDERSAAFHAENIGVLETIDYLILQGAKVDAQDKFGNAPLHLAEREDYAAQLIKHDANISIPNKAGLLPIETAKENENRSVVALLEKAAKKKVKIGM